MFGAKHIVCILTCEHARNTIPIAYQSLFTHARQDLKGHRGFDIGSEIIFDTLSSALSCFSKKGEYSRLLVDLNRSESSHSLFSTYMQPLSIEEKKHVLYTYYVPYRKKVVSEIEKNIKIGKTILHLSIHSFTPILNGVERQTDIGLLYDPKDYSEKLYCSNLKSNLQEILPDFVIRKNYPYRGNADGFTTFCRKIFPAHYLGIELEFNQKHLYDKQQCLRIANKVIIAVSE